MPASIPSGPKCNLTSFPQCWHLISRTVHSVSVPSSSKMRRLHLGLGHLIISICHRLLYSTPASNRPYFPPPRTDNYVTREPDMKCSCLVPFYRLCIYLSAYRKIFIVISSPVNILASNKMPLPRAILSGHSCYWNSYMNQCASIVNFAIIFTFIFLLWIKPSTLHIRNWRIGMS